MIELAPNWKRGLALAHPLIVAGGYSDFLDAPNVGAVVTLPTTLHPRAGAPPPRIVEIPGGVLVNTGAANPGLTRALRELERASVHATTPVIVALAAQSAHAWGAMAARLERIPSIGGVQVELNPTMDARALISATRAATELPILAHLDLANARQIAASCVDAGANALVIARAPRGMVLRDGKKWHGRLYAPSVKPLALHALEEIRDLRLEIPLVGCGGIHTAHDAREFLAAGACAIEIDSAVWVDPNAIAEIGQNLGDADERR